LIHSSLIFNHSNKEEDSKIYVFWFLAKKQVIAFWHFKVTLA